jgi:hypothetical protein
MRPLPTLPVGRKLSVASGALMLWVALAPWIWGYSGSPAAVASHIFFLLSFGPLSLLIAVLRPAALVVLAAGLWLALSPWVLGYATNHSAWLSDGVTGVLLSCVAAHAAELGISRLASRRGKRHESAASRRVIETAGSRS